MVDDKKVDLVDESDHKLEGESSDSIVAASREGMEKSSEDTVTYYRQRKNGMRDKDTKEILGDQPTFYDSHATAVAPNAAAEALSKPGGELRTGGKRAATGDAGVPSREKAASDARAAAVALFGRPPEYPGEIIEREVEPGVANDTKGKNLEQIAREHLGPEATEDQVTKHVREIAHINNIKDPAAALEGQSIRLPGHTRDGALVTEDDNHNRKTVWADGSVVVKNADGTGYDYHPKSDGSYTEHRWGPDPEDNYDVQRTADGRYEISGKHDSASYDKIIDAERVRLENLAEKIEVPEHREVFKRDMEKLQRRADDLEKVYKARYEKEGLAPEEAARKAERRAAEEIIGTYREVARMLEAPNEKPIPPGERETVAMQVMHHAADPTTIDQGQHPTCNVATAEARLYTRSPSSVARVVADTAINGEYKTRGTPPMTIKLDRQSLQPDQEAMFHPPNSQDRSYASQLFQVTAVNVAWEKANQRDGTKIAYEQHESTSPDDSGGRLVDYAKKPPEVKKNKDGSPKDNPGITNDEIIDIYNEVAGTREDKFLIERPYWTTRASSKVDSPEALGARLADMKMNGELPAIIYIHTGKEPFYTDSGGGAAGGSGGWHVVSVTDYHPAEAGPPPKPARVEIDNQWGEQVDRKGNQEVDVAVLHETMSSPYQDLGREIAADRAAGKIPTDKELERLQMDKADISEKEYEDRLVKLLVENQKAWEETVKRGPPTPEAVEEHERAVAKAVEVLEKLPRAKRIAIDYRVRKALA